MVTNRALTAGVVQYRMSRLFSFENRLHQTSIEGHPVMAGALESHLDPRDGYSKTSGLLAEWLHGIQLVIARLAGQSAQWFFSRANLAVAFYLFNLSSKGDCGM